MPKPPKGPSGPKGQKPAAPVPVAPVLPGPVHHRPTGGKRRKMSPAELDALSRITPADIARAKAAWQQDAPPRFRPLLDATDDGSSDGSSDGSAGGSGGPSE